MLKKTLSILFCLFLSLSLSANTNNNTNGTAYGTEKNEEAKKLESSKEAESAEQSQALDKSEPDSSYYSVNKFNFLFYFVYKMKYMDGEDDIEPSKD